MASVVCPHCSAKIRLTRKKSKPSASSRPKADPETNNVESHPTKPVQAKPPSLPVPELPSDKSKTAGAIENDSQAEALSNLNIPTKRQTENLNDLQIDASSPDPPELGGDFPEVSTRRKKARLDLDQLADIEPQRRSLSSLAGPETEDESGESPTEAGDNDQAKSDLADDLLPPKFLVPDIEADENAVVLPAAGGGLQVVDKTEVRVMHEGRSVKLVSLSPEELRRVRLIENLVALLIAGIMLAVALWLVL